MMTSKKRQTTEEDEKLEKLEEELGEKLEEELGEELACEVCGSVITQQDLDSGEAYETEVFDQPHEIDGRIVRFCSDECQEEYLAGDFPFIDCTNCGRKVCYQNPLNGYEVQFNTKPHYHDGDDDDDGYDDYDSAEDIICAKCYEEAVFEKGQPRESFLDDLGNKNEPASQIIDETLPYWVSQKELVDAGFHRDANFTNFKITDESDAVKVNSQALHLIDLGKRVVVFFNATSTTTFLGEKNNRGVATIFVKNGKKGCQDEEGQNEDGHQDEGGRQDEEGRPKTKKHKC